MLMKNFDSTSKGFSQHGKAVESGAIMNRIPDHFNDAAMSVCGIKDFLIDEHREFINESGEAETIACASVAALEITDSPVHIHQQTTETYTILAGEGKMILGTDLRDIKQNDVILIPPGVQHGLFSTTEGPVKVLMTFSPGMASIDYPAYRDETIIHPSSSQISNSL